MVDTHFFTKAKEHSVDELATITNSQVIGDKNVVITNIMPLNKAGSGDLSFLDNMKYKKDFLKTNAAACFISPEMKKSAPKGTVLLVSPNPYKSYAIAVQNMYPEFIPESEISRSAYIDETVQLGKGCVVEPSVVIMEGAEIGNNCWIEAGAVIGRNVKIGNDCRIGSNASVYYAVIGNNVRIYPGVRIGQDGFGFAIDPEGFVKVPQLGRVIIEDSVEIGANTTIDKIILCK
jgi:UDP-3-O-[3-hydroxymyristoyl] glucosamine N-acyltransferase